MSILAREMTDLLPYSVVVIQSNPGSKKHPAYITPSKGHLEIVYVVFSFFVVSNYFPGFHLQLSDDSNGIETKLVLLHHPFSWLRVSEVTRENVEGFEPTIDSFVSSTGTTL